MHIDDLNSEEECDCCGHGECISRPEKKHRARAENEEQRFRRRRAGDLVNLRAVGCPCLLKPALLHRQPKRGSGEGYNEESIPQPLP